jgi:tetratricopeptide (TPR) repeat protein
MLLDNLGLFLDLYRRPRRAFSGILDQGSILFGAALVVMVSAIQVAARSLHTMIAAAGAPTAPGRPPAPPELFALASLTSSLGDVFGLALLYAPFALLALTVFEPVGSFGVAFRRDFGPLLAVTFFAWAAARLPFALLALTPSLLGLGSRAFVAYLVLWALGGIAFAALMVIGLQTTFGARLASAVAVALIAPVALLLEPFLALLASPFVLFFAWRYFRGDLGDVTWSFGARQSFKRHLQASTLNPRDASAHYHLGLIHQQRRQYAEAQERFRRAVEIDPTELDAHYQLGRIAREEKRYEDAIRHFESVVARDDAHARSEVWREIGSTYLESGSLDHARWALSKYVERRPHDPEGLLRYGEALQAAGDAAGAAEQFRACVEAVDTMPAFRRREVARWKRAARQKLAGSG